MQYEPDVGAAARWNTRTQPTVETIGIEAGSTYFMSPHRIQIYPMPVVAGV